ncbi:MAG: response regulator [Flavobacteriales bacterium]|jgi:DNA-binding LytR/AlgR family response regulator|nr:MAG: response regulator [Flavobacteriales bacterium]
MPVRILVVEDEAIVRRDIEQTLRQLGHAVVGTAADGQGAIDRAEADRPDLVLMDIMLKGDMSGIEAAMVIGEQLGIPVIFLTAYSDETTISRARIAEPYGYMVKPFKAVEVQASIEMALHKHAHDAELRRERDQLHELATREAAGPLFLKHGGRQVRVPLEDVYYISALKDYFSVHVKDKRYIVHGTMKSIESRLPADKFLRVHRSFIVRLDRIEAIEAPHVIMEDGKGSIPIGDSYYAKLLERVAGS